MDGYRHDAVASSAGATLLEVLVAASIVAILAVLAALPVVWILRASREARAIANLKSVAAAEMMLYGTGQRFRVFEELFREGSLSRQFERGAAGGGPRGSATEAISDGVYVYTIRYESGASGITIDADPAPPYAPSYRRFRMRIGRVASGAGGGECTLLVAAPSARSPPTNAYRPFGQ